MLKWFIRDQQSRENFENFLTIVRQRFFCMFFLIYSILEVNAIYGAKIVLNSDSPQLKIWWVKSLWPIIKLYDQNALLLFVILIAFFNGAVYNTLNTTRYVRFNIVQAVLIEVVISFYTQVIQLLPPVVRESLIGEVLATTGWLSTHVAVLYCIVHIIYGQYPLFPLISEGARLNIQIFR